MNGTRTLFLNARSATFIFGKGEFFHLKPISISGQADLDNASNIAGISFILQVKEVTDDFNFDKIKNPHYEEFKKAGLTINEELYCYGNAILLNPGEHIKKELIDISLLLTSVEFSHLKDILDKFFLGTVQLSVHIQIVGMELGHEPWLDKFPPEQNLSVVGYGFIVHSKELEI